MTWLAPGFLAAAAAASAIVVALHLIMHRRPPPTVFPTARFVPAGSARALRRAVRPNDVPLMLLRVSTLLLAGGALARPVSSPDRRPTARVVVLDQSRAVAEPAAARDSALRLVAEGDRLVVFDSVARLTTPSPDSVAAAAGGGARGNLSAALIAAIHAAPQLRRTADSIELVVVSAFAREEIDVSTAAIRAQWPGRIRLVRVAGDTSGGESREHPAVEVGAPSGDALAAAVSLVSSTTAGRTVRLVRTAPTPGDSSWARTGGVLVHWPVDDTKAARPEDAVGGSSATSSPAMDTIGAVMAGNAVVVAPFQRAARPGSGGRPVAWWADGEVAATERAAGAGCIREVSVPIPAKGDLVLRPSFRRFLLAMLEPCGGRVDQGETAEETLVALAGSGPLARASAMPAQDERSRLAPWLLVAALLLAVAEPFVRQRERVE